MTNEITEDRDGNELTPEEAAMYNKAMGVTQEVLRELKGQPVAILQAIAFNLFERYMQMCSSPDDLKSVAEVIRKMADDMDNLAKLKSAPTTGLLN